MSKKSAVWLSLVCALLLSVPASASNPILDLAGGTDSAAPAETSQDTAPGAQKSLEIHEPFMPSPTDPKANAARLEAIDEMLTEWGRLSADEAAARFYTTPEKVSARVEVITSLKNAYPRINESLDRLQKFTAELEKLKLDNAAPQLALTDKPPYSMNYYNNFLEALDDIRKQAEEAQDDCERTASIAEASKETVAEQEAAWRLARDTWEKEKSPQNVWALQDASYALENARAQHVIDTFEKEKADLTAVMRDLQYTRRSSLKKYILDNVDLSEEAFKRQMEEMDASVAKLEAMKPDVIRQLKSAERAASAAAKKTAAAKDDAEKEAAAAEESYRVSALDRYRDQMDQLQQSLVLMAQRRSIWTLRYDLKRGAADKTALPETVKKLALQVEALDNELVSVQKDLLSLQTKQSTLEKLMDSTESKQVLAVLKKHRDMIQGSIKDCLSYSGAVVATAAQQRHFILELEEMYDSVSLTDKAAAMWRKRAEGVLNTELWQSGGYGVRVKEFALALAIIVFGTWVGKRIVRLMARAAARHFKFDETSRRTLERFAFYILIIVIFLTALYIVSIPLTAFAFLGGAVAIAVGFGAQNMFNNLISGIILTLNRPFRLGDTIEVGNISGVVMDLGVRSTLIRTFDEREVIVPNSQLLDNQMVNWSLSDALMRGSVAFSVCYGTPAALVRETALKVASENPRVLASPAPWVLFANFGASSLDFTLYFWVNQKIISATKAAGELREGIQTAFDAAGIGMPFPQLDVHFTNTLDVSAQKK